MANAQIVNDYQEAGFACLVARVNEGPTIGVVEYIGRVPLGDEWDALTVAQKRAALVQAAKVVRDNQIRPVAPALGLSGVVAI